MFNGTITAKKAGNTTVTVTSGADKSIIATVAVSVTNPKPVNIAVTKIDLSPTTITLETGKTSVIKSVVTPDNATDKSIKWSSSDTSIADVTNGTITAKKAGTATITVTSNSTKSVTGKVSVTVTEQKPVEKPAEKPVDDTVKGE